MKERPILFSTLMVQALLVGNKTQTRRIVKLSKKMDPMGEKAFCYLSVDGGWVIDNGNGLFMDGLKSRFGKSGDTLWVRETWLKCQDGFIYRADHYGDDKLTSENGKTFNKSVKWHPSIFMPKVACRIRLHITDIRVERLQDISEEDTIAEGIGRDRDGWKSYETIHTGRYKGKKHPYS